MFLLCFLFLFPPFKYRNIIYFLFFTITAVPSAPEGPLVTFSVYISVVFLFPPYKYHNIIYFLFFTLTAVPSAPEGPLEPTDITATTVTIEWKPPKSDGGLPLTAYILERRDVKRMTWIKVDRVKPNITSYCIQDLVTGNDYFFRVFAENEEGISLPLETVKPIRPQRPPGE